MIWPWLKAAAAMPNQPTPISRLAAIFQNALAAGPQAAPDFTAIDTLANALTPEFKVTAFYLTAQYLDQHGQKEKALEYLRRCVTGGDSYNYFDLVLADDALRHHGVDPLELERSVRPDHLCHLQP
jgi:hypothetical protein